MRTGRRLALDVGKARIGVAVSDFHGILASPVGFLARLESIEATAASWQQFLKTHEQLTGVEFLECYVGLPISLNGLETESTRDAIAVGEAFEELLGAPVRYIDERLTTVTAAAQMRDSGFNAKTGRSKIDSVAATLILEQALSIEKNTGSTPGRTALELGEAHE